MTTEDKERIEKEEFNATISKELDSALSGSDIITFSDGTEFVRKSVAISIMAKYGQHKVQQELQAYRDIIKELLPFAIKAQYSTSIHNEKGREDVRKILSTIERARKLIDTVTPTSNPEQS